MGGPAITTTNPLRPRSSSRISPAVLSNPAEIGVAAYRTKTQARCFSEMLQNLPDTRLRCWLGLGAKIFELDAHKPCLADSDEQIGASAVPVVVSVYVWVSTFEIPPPGAPYAFPITRRVEMG